MLTKHPPKTIILFALLFLIGCTSQPITPFELTSQLNYHDGYWVTKMEIPDQPISVTVVNDMHIDNDTNLVTVYAQVQLLGKAVVPAQVGPGECTESFRGDTACFHPNAVYLNGSGQDLAESDDTGSWWVKHAWILDGEGYNNCEMILAEVYDDCFWVEGVLLDDGLSMQVGVAELGQEGFYNIRTPLLDQTPIGYKVTRFAPKNNDPELGEVDLTPTEQFVLIWECKEEPSAFDNRTRECPKQQD
jgi:hypothetical protein